MKLSIFKSLVNQYEQAWLQNCALFPEWERVKAIQLRMTAYSDDSDIVTEADILQQQNLASFSENRMATFFREIDKLFKEIGCITPEMIDLVIELVGNHLEKPELGVVNDYVGAIDLRHPVRKVILDNEEYQYIESEEKGSSIIGGLASVNKAAKIGGDSATFFAVKKIHHYENNALDLVKRETKYLNFMNRSAKAYRDIDKFFVLMPWVDGTLLKSVTPKAMTDIPFQQRITACIPFLEDIEKLHRAGRVHGDIKPRNVIYEIPFKLHLIDFNSAHREYSRKKHPYTDLYTDPRKVDKNTSTMVDDIYALACIFRKVFPELSNIDKDQLMEVAALRCFVEYLLVCDADKRCLIGDVVQFFKRLENPPETLTRGEIWEIIQNIQNRPANSEDILSGKLSRRLFL